MCPHGAQRHPGNSVAVSGWRGVLDVWAGWRGSQADVEHRPQRACQLIEGYQALLGVHALELTLDVVAVPTVSGIGCARASQSRCLAPDVLGEPADGHHR